MNAPANTWASIYRGTTIDSHGDVIDDNGTPVSTGVPLSLVERAALVTRKDETTPRIVRQITGRVTRGTDVQAGDRIRTADERWLIVDAVTPSNSQILPGDTKLTLRHVSY